MANKGWTWTWQRFGRYKYQKPGTHNQRRSPGGSTPSLTDVPPVQVAPRYRRDDGAYVFRILPDKVIAHAKQWDGTS